MDQPASTPVLEFDHVSLAFDEKQVLSDISFRMEHAGTLILLGVAGTGKSVLLKLALGLLKPDAGRIKVDGLDVVPLAEAELRPIRKGMGMVFQEGALFDSLSVYENVAYPLREAGEKSEETIEKRVREVLGFVEMEHAMEKLPSALSGGMRRRVAIARAIVSRPGIMLYDSPTAGLDPVTAHTITVLIAKLRDVERVSSIVVTHRLQDGYVLSLFTYAPGQKNLVPTPANGDKGSAPATRFMVLRDGGIYFQGTGPELGKEADPYLHKFLV
ncbi:MAG TPA: ATP-binding cassette domain-containing protein [Terriglobia bacterium]|nr:ATP-binding cassette domain-containing protein [Terriglobia bacterium]